MRNLFIAAATLSLALAAGCGNQEPTGDGHAAKIRIGMVAKSLGNGFFDAVNDGAQEAGRDVDAEIIFVGPTTPSAEGQIETLNSLIAQRVDAIAVSANDPDALVPTLKKAMNRGIKVISYDSAVADPGRHAHLAPSSDPLIGETVVALVAELAPQVDGRGQGKFAVVSATPTSTNQNAWLTEIRRVLPQHPGLELVAVAYGDDVSDKSYREAVALLKQHPDLAVLVSISSVGIVASAKAVEDERLTGKVKVTGLGLPSELAGYVQKGVVPKFAIWNPVDLGYASVRVAAHLARGGSLAQPVDAGRMGKIRFAGDGVGAMSKPFIYDAGNVAEFARIF